MITGRDLLVATLAACLTFVGITLAQSRKPMLTSSVFDWNAIEAKATKTGARRDFFEGPTATLDMFECHVTTINPGEAPHAPHQHPEEELIIRNNMHFSLRTNPIEQSDLESFVRCYKPKNRDKRTPTWSTKDPTGRWRVFSYDELLKRDKFNLDLTWLDNATEPDPVNPGDIAKEILDDLRTAISQISDVALAFDLPDRKG